MGIPMTRESHVSDLSHWARGNAGRRGWTLLCPRATEGGFSHSNV